MPSLRGLEMPDFGAELSERLVEQARDVHLREPELRGDPPLAEPAEVTQADDPALAAGKLPKPAGDQDALLAELEPALGRGVPGGLSLDVERHGRPAAADLSRTVGFLTSLSPAVMRVGPGRGVEDVVEQLRRVPRDGLGHGLLRYLGEPEDREVLARLARPDVAFNYLGRWAGQPAEGAPVLRPLREGKRGP